MPDAKRPATRPPPAAQRPAPQPTPLARLLGLWLLRVAVVTAIAVALATWQGASPWLWVALLAYAAASLLSTFMLDRARRRAVTPPTVASPIATSPTTSPPAVTPPEATGPTAGPPVASPKTDRP